MLKIPSGSGVRLLLLAGVSAASLAVSVPSVRAQEQGADSAQMQAAPTVAVKDWGKLPNGKEVQMITLKNAQGVAANILTYGAVVQSVYAPDKDGNVADITLGWDSLKGYLDHANDGRPYFGATVGRIVNRIAKGTFTLNGRVYHTPITNGPNTNHGGHFGFDRQLWRIIKTGHDAKSAWVTLGLTSPDGQEGFPGKLEVQVTYRLNSDNEITLHYEATTNKPTVLSMTNHSYWNLNGEGSGSVEPETLQIDADRYTPTDNMGIPTGHIDPVAGTDLDFRQPTRIGDRVRSSETPVLNRFGIDHNFVLNGDRTLGLDHIQTIPQYAATIKDPRSGRTLEVSTTEPGIVAYTGNSLDGTLVGPSGHTYRQTDAIAMEASHFPDSVHHKNFPSVELKPGQTYQQTTVWKLGVEK